MQILEARGLEVFLVKARYAKNVPGRRTDVSDCQWLQYLHSVGLSRASFRPALEVCAVRSLLRHRDGLVELASHHVRHMQKALDQMNLQLHHVISDITGTTSDHHHMIENPRAYDEGVVARLEIRYRQRVENRLKAQARALGFSLIPTPTPSHS